MYAITGCTTGYIQKSVPGDNIISYFNFTRQHYLTMTHNMQLNKDYDNMQLNEEIEDTKMIDIFDNDEKAMTRQKECVHMYKWRVIGEDPTMPKTLLCVKCYKGCGRDPLYRPYGTVFFETRDFRRSTRGTSLLKQYKTQDTVERLACER